MNKQEKINHEKRIIQEMIELYAHKNGTKEEAETLIQYANERIDHCVMMENKTFCSACKIHCYNQEMREKIRTVMRYSAPRMIYSHPILLIKHWLISRKDKKQ